MTRLEKINARNALATFPAKREREREREQRERSSKRAAAAALGGAETVQRAADEIHRDEAKVEAVAIRNSTARRQTESAVNGERVILVVVVVVVVVERVGEEGGPQANLYKPLGEDSF